MPAVHIFDRSAPPPSPATSTRGFNRLPYRRRWPACISRPEIMLSRCTGYLSPAPGRPPSQPGTAGPDLLMKSNMDW
eukprot:16435154-Heterocapsa_arctica.AAC.1